MDASGQNRKNEHQSNFWTKFTPKKFIWSNFDNPAYLKFLGTKLQLQG